MFHLKLNICRKPIVYKYREGKMKSTLRRELKEPEIGEEEGYRLAYFMNSFEIHEVLGGSYHPS